MAMTEGAAKLFDETGAIALIDAVQAKTGNLQPQVARQREDGHRHGDGIERSQHDAVGVGWSLFIAALINAEEEEGEALFARPRPYLILRKFGQWFGGGLSGRVAFCHRRHIWTR